MKILIVDDELVSRKKMGKILGSLGECEMFENPLEAITAFEIALIEGNPFNLILLDVEMPEMSGMAVLKKIRAIEGQKNIPAEKQAKIMMVTMSKEKSVVMECIQAGCNNYITKPFNKELVIEKIEAMGVTILK